MGDKLFEISDVSVDMKEYTKVRCKAALNDTISFSFLVYNDNAPVDLSKYKVEFRARLTSGAVYSEVDNISVSGNELTVNCDSRLCSQIGEQIITLRLFDITTYQQKSNYIIILKVMSTIDADEEVQSESILSALESLDVSINRYIELQADLGSKITEANLAITNISTSIINANTTKTALDLSNTNATSTKNALNTSIAIGQSLKDNLDASIDTANITKTNLDGSRLLADVIKSDLQAEILTADTKLNEFKLFDTNQIVVKQNEMYNEMFPINELLTIEHNLGGNPLVQFIITEDGYGMGTYGTSSYGGISECNLGTYKTQYVTANKLKIIVSNNYNKPNPIVTKFNDYEYTVTFVGYNKTMTIKLIV